MVRGFTVTVLLNILNLTQECTPVLTLVPWFRVMPLLSGCQVLPVLKAAFPFTDMTVIFANAVEAAKRNNTTTARIMVFLDLMVIAPCGTESR